MVPVGGPGAPHIYIMLKKASMYRMDGRDVESRYDSDQCLMKKTFGL